LEKAGQFPQIADTSVLAWSEISQCRANMRDFFSSGDGFWPLSSPERPGLPSMIRAFVCLSPEKNGKSIHSQNARIPSTYAKRAQTKK